MLSAETAAGSYPAESVAMMHQIITQAESDSSYFSRIQSDKDLSDCDDMADAITYAACEITDILPNMAAFITYSASGFTALSMARERPTRPILAITLSEQTARRLGLVWGIQASVNTEVFKDFTKLEETAVATAQKAKVGKKGSYLVITAGYPIGMRGMTNLIYTVQL